MSKQSTIQVRIEGDLKSQADTLFGALGTSLSEAVRLFVAQSVHERRLPFTPSLLGSEGNDAAFGALAHYGQPALPQEERAAWLSRTQAPTRAGATSRTDQRGTAAADASSKGARISHAHASSSHAAGASGLRATGADGCRAGTSSLRATGAGKTEPVLVDETILLRYLLRDDERKADTAHRLILGGNVHAHPETIVKTVGILSDTYRVPRSLIGSVIGLLLEDIAIFDVAAVRLAARLFAEGKTSFDACLLDARHIIGGYRVESFDRSVARRG